MRRQIVARASALCEYCKAPQHILMNMDIDHIIPVSKNGPTELDNLCLSCINCNSHKHDHMTGIDPITGEDTALFNPRNQFWLEHFKWVEASREIIGITSTGRATVQRLSMNDQEVVDARHYWMMAGWHPPYQEESQ
jgi:hypothetical protein